MEIIFWGFLVRFLQCLIQASGFILVGLFIAGIFRRLLDSDGTRKLFGEGTNRSLFQAWLVGMLLPVCSLGVIPVIREMRRIGLKGGTILAFAMAAPLFNPLSLLYGLTLSEPFTILAFAFCSLLVVTCVGVLWDRFFPNTAQKSDDGPRIGYGIKRMLSIGVLACREIAGPSLGYIAIGLCGVAALGALIPANGLQHAMNGDDPLAPLTMSTVATPVYATPMLAMSQLGMMFQHANSPGAAFVLLVLGAGMNLGLAWWMVQQYGFKRSLTWFGMLMVIVLGLAYGIDRPLYPTDIDPSDHTHAFDIYCQPFHTAEPNMPRLAMDMLDRKTEPYERQATLILLGFFCVGCIIRLVDRRWSIDAWLEYTPPVDETQSKMNFDVVLPGWVLGGVSLIGLVVFSVVGCYAYYPPPEEVLEEMRIVKTDALSGANTGDISEAKYWIEVYDDWSRKLEVGAFIRNGELSEYHHWKARLLREQLELLEHEIEHQDKEEIQHLVAKISITHSRLKRAFTEEL